jgi:hypothetical protein
MEEKKIKGQTFLQKLGRSLSGEQPRSPEDDAARYEAKTKAVEAQDRYNLAVDKVKNPPSVVEMQKETAQRLADEKKEAEERARAAEERERERAKQEAEEARKEAEAAGQARIQAENELKAQQNQILLEKIEELKASQKPIHEQFMEYFSFAQSLAEKMGFAKPGTSQPQSENPQLALEIAKINAESAQKDREFQLQMEESKRKWELEMIKLKDGQDIERAKLAQAAERDKAILQAPQILGGAIAQGLLDRTQGGASHPATSKPETFRIQAGVDEAGTLDCPVCNSRGVPNQIGIGPTSKLVTCVGCNSQFEIVRISKEEV